MVSGGEKKPRPAQRENVYGGEKRGGKNWLIWGKKKRGHLRRKMSNYQKDVAELDVDQGGA